MRFCRKRAERLGAGAFSDSWYFRFADALRLGSAEAVFVVLLALFFALGLAFGFAAALDLDLELAFGLALALALAFALLFARVVLVGTSSISAVADVIVDLAALVFRRVDRAVASSGTVCSSDCTFLRLG